MINWEEYKRDDLIKNFKWYIKQLERCKEEEPHLHIIKNLICNFNDTINEFDIPRYYIWFYYNNEDKWIKSVGSLNKENLEKYATDGILSRDADKWMIFKENEMPSIMNDEVMQHMIRIYKNIESEKDIKANKKAQKYVERVNDRKRLDREREEGSLKFYEGGIDG